MLTIREIDTYYGESQALFGVSLDVGEGEVVTLLGRNGMGKSTTIKSIMNLAAIRKGTITFCGKEIGASPSYCIARLGIGLVPEGRQIFPNLTVRENILVTAANHTGSAQPYTMDDILTIFPRIGDRLDSFGNQLSGGEQQMLAIGRALMINPKLLVLDEATEGLAPLVRQEIWRGLTILKSKGLSILVVDKNLGALFRIADRHYIMEKGKIVWTGTNGELCLQPELQSRYLGV
ncbi:ABC transporter ATP-binding protein [Desulforhopalus singaporensis]|uniref:Branched-chain amino acid transport system ATP-binding protein n=1 Tax=Desulforhopalus singaporensis TaxID=91360 RepID=A0A1H0SBM3_9BACT|nr:ABC transporter ATP-binding protein [Desulforhopalus singaporensis]SDP38909.1 branched-chain amino acid transport system ATP-binding protein [Desulforhopalus singaporensis]